MRLILKENIISFIQKSICKLKCDFNITEANNNSYNRSYMFGNIHIYYELIYQLHFDK